MFRYVKNSMLKNIILGLLAELLCIGFFGCDNTDIHTPEQTPVSTPATEQSGKLFDASHYAVLPGEGAFYYVYDCNGTVVDRFWKPNSTYQDLTGLYSKTDIQFGYNFATLKNNNEGHEFQYDFTVHVGEQCYWIYENLTGQIRVYDKKDNLLYETKGYPIQANSNWFASSGVLEVSQGFIVYVRDDWRENITDWEEPVFVNWDGTVTKLQLGENNRLAGTLGDDCLVVKSKVQEGSWGSEHYDICDYQGNILVSDVIIVAPRVISMFEGADFSFCATGYIHENQIYDANLQRVEATMPDYFSEKDPSYFQFWTGTDYIADAIYQVDGMPYTATFDGTGLFAVRDGKLHLIWNHKQFSFAINEDITASCNINAISNGLVHVLGKEKGYIFRLTDQSCIAQLEDTSVELADTWFVVRRYGEGETVSIYDDKGALRYETATGDVKITYGNYMVLQRGPYIGIADLEGNYIIKALLPDIVSDSVREEEEIW